MWFGSLLWWSRIEATDILFLNGTVTIWFGMVTLPHAIQLLGVWGGSGERCFTLRRNSTQSSQVSNCTTPLWASEEVYTLGMGIGI